MQILAWLSIQTESTKLLNNHFSTLSYEIQLDGELKVLWTLCIGKHFKWV